MPRGRPANTSQNTNTSTTTISGMTGTNRTYARAITQVLQPLLEQGWYHSSFQGVHFIGQSFEAVNRACAQMCSQQTQGAGGGINTNQLAGGTGGTGQTRQARQRPQMSEEARRKLSLASKRRWAARKKEAGQAQSSTGRGNQKTMAAGGGGNQ